MFVGCFEISISIIIKHDQSIVIIKAFLSAWIDLLKILVPGGAWEITGLLFARGWSVPRLKLRSLTELQAKLGDFKKRPGICQKRKLESNECDTNRISLKEQLWMPTNKYTLKVNKGKSRKWCETCLKLTINTPERRYCSRSGVFIVNFDMFHIFFLLFLLLTLSF